MILEIMLYIVLFMGLISLLEVIVVTSINTSYHKSIYYYDLFRCINIPFRIGIIVDFLGIYTVYGLSTWNFTLLFAITVLLTVLYENKYINKKTKFKHKKLWSGEGKGERITRKEKDELAKRDKYNDYHAYKILNE